ncbi:hypothetical protein D3C87_1822010 [compost metagenome]
MLHRLAIAALAHDVILVEDVTEEMPVIQLQDQLLLDGRRQCLEPVAVVARQGDIQRHDILDRFVMDRPIPNRRPGRGESMQECLAAFLGGTAKEIALATLEQLTQIRLGRRNRSG